MPHDLRYNKFLLFGDSITEFGYESQPIVNEEQWQTPQFTFGSAITNVYTRRLDVIQRGFAGYNSEQAKKILPRVIKNEHREDSPILISTLFFGTNDAALGGPQHVPLEKFIQNTRQLLDLYKLNGIKVVLIGPAKHNPEDWEPTRQEFVKQGNIRNNATNKKYSDALFELSKEFNIPFANLYEKFDEAEDWRNLLTDGVHFASGGYKILFNEVLRLIRQWYPELAPENLEYILPGWRDLSKGAEW